MLEHDNILWTCDYGIAKNFEFRLQNIELDQYDDNRQALFYIYRGVNKILENSKRCNKIKNILYRFVVDFEFVEKDKKFKKLYRKQQQSRVLWHTTRKVQIVKARLK